ncbi:MAG TPA: TetR/AcrR family transcriptional regulator [Novimethylophilus sp.]|uniref:TetR/AcrR family transcriptional regulator n=1 Tax=Novimethylophilus sp. TaxID=2137426 RepID=UPI002F3F75D1
MNEPAVASLNGKTGRPVGFVREQAIEAAMHLFWKKGFLAVSAKDLADAMNIQRSSFYNSFGSREAVFIEALRRYAEQSPDAPLDHVAPGQAVVPVLVSTLRRICHARAKDAEGRGCLVCNGMAELVGVEESIGPILEQAVKHRTSVIRHLLQQAISQGEIGMIENEDAAARAFVAFLIGLNTISKIVRDEGQLWAMCRAFLAGQRIPKAALD